MKFRKISPFCGQILESFPFIAEDFDQMTEYALYCKLKEKIDQLRIGVNNLGDDVNEYIIKFDALKNYVDNYFDSLEIEEEISNALNEMAENGTLEQIINNQIFFNLSNNLKQQLYSTRLYRQLVELGVSNQTYAHLGGVCYIGDGNIVICKTGNLDTSLGKIQVIRLSDGAVLRETTDTIYHCNSITYNPNTGKLYVAPTYIDNSNTILIEFDYLTLNKIRDINVTYLLGSITYDRDNNRYFGKLDEAGIKVAEYNENFEVQQLIDLDFPDEFNGTQQAIEYYNNHIYFSTSVPNIIFQFDLEGNFINSYQIGNWIDDSFGVGELEDISITDEGDLYFGSEMNYQNSNWKCINIAKTSLTKNTTNYNIAYDSSVTFQQAWINIYVDNTKSIINPTGTSTKPFKEIFEAVNFASSPLMCGKNVKITIATSQNNYNYTYINSRNIVNITSTSGNKANVKINGLQFSGITCLLNQLTILNRYAKEVYGVPLDVGDNSFIKIHSCDITNNQQGVNNAIVVNYSNVSGAGSITITNTGLNDVNLTANSSFKIIANMSIRKVANSQSIDTEQMIFDGTLTNTGSTGNYTNSITKTFLNQSNYRYCNVSYLLNNALRVKKFIYNKNDKLCFTDINITDDAQASTYQVYECMLQLNESNVEMIVNKDVSDTGGVTQNRISVKQIWLSNT